MFACVAPEHIVFNALPFERSVTTAEVAARTGLPAEVADDALWQLAEQGWICREAIFGNEIRYSR